MTGRRGPATVALLGAWALAGCVGALHASAPTPEPGSPADASVNKVAFDVLARATADGARLGLRYRIAPGWHIYWTNPGESGMATTATVQVPDSMSAGALRFPGPDRFGDDVLGYGYSGEVVLFVDVTGAPQGEATVASRWLVCNDICEPESGEATVSLSGLSPQVPAMAPFEARLPRADVPEDRLSVRVEGDGLIVTVTDAEAVSLFPSLALEAAMGGRRPSFLREEIVNSAAVHVLRATVAGPLAGDESLGVLRIERGAGLSFVDLRLPRPASETP